MSEIPKHEHDWLKKMTKLAEMSNRANAKYERDKNQHAFYLAKTHCLVELMSFMIQDGVSMEYILEGNPILAAEDKVIASITDEDLSIGYEILKKYKDELR